MKQPLKNIIAKFIFSSPQKIPDVDHAGFTKFSPGPDGSAPEFYRMAELYFVTEDLMKQSLGTPGGKTAAADIPKFATGGFLFLVGTI